MLDQRLRHAWQARERAVPLSPLLNRAPEGLVLGAGTERQIAAAGDRPMTWYFAEPEAAAFARKLFDADNKLRGSAYKADGPISRRVSLSITAGGKVSGDTRLETGDYKTLADPALVTYPLFNAALLAINVGWPPVWAYAYAYRLDYDKSPLFPGAELFPYSAFHIPWLGYLPASLATGLEMPPDILTERTPDDGLLMSPTEDRLDPTIPEHWRRARMIAETVVAGTGQSLSKRR